MATAQISQTQNQDWAGRYYHIDQVLNSGGPRTDPQFAAGDEVNKRVFCVWSYLKKSLCTGEEIPTRNVQDLGHRCRWPWLRDPRELGVDWVQEYPRN